MVVWKYKLDVKYTGRRPILMPPGAKLLTVQLQHGEPCLWALVDETKPSTELRQIRFRGTGDTLHEEPIQYLGTLQFDGGDWVLHVFEVPVASEI